MWPDLRKGTLTFYLECIDFKDAYLRKAMHNLNETWVASTAGVAALAQIRSGISCT